MNLEFLILSECIGVADNPRANQCHEGRCAISHGGGPGPCSNRKLQLEYFVSTIDGVEDAF